MEERDLGNYFYSCFFFAAWPLFHALSVAIRVLCCNVVYMIGKTSVWFFLYSTKYMTKRQQLHCSQMLQMHLHNHFFWHSSALLPSLRHPTSLCLEFIRRHLLANQAQRGYWLKLITEMIASTHSHSWHIKTGTKMNVLARNFLAPSSFCYPCNFILDVAVIFTHAITYLCIFSVKTPRISIVWPCNSN